MNDYHYKILGIKPSASQIEIDGAYNKLVKRNDEERRINEENKQKLATAYNMVSKKVHTVDLHNGVYNKDSYDRQFHLDRHFGYIDNFLKSFSMHNNETDENDKRSFFYTKESVTKLKDNVLQTHVVENNNGKVSEYKNTKPLSKTLKPNSLDWK